jgi:ankyrin repeat protein
MQARDYLGLFPASVKIQDQDFLQTLFLLDRETFNNIMCAEMFFGIYFRQELNFYFTSLYEAFHNFAGKLVFALNNIGHEMAFYYDPGISRFWGFLNPNTMVVTYLKDENLLSKYVLNGFRSREVAMQLKIYCDRKDQSAVMERIQIWKKSPQWQAIHTINPVKIKMRDTKGTTLLALGAYHNNIELVRQLLTAKANPEIPRYSGANAMLMSAQHGNIPLMQLLNQYGASYEGHVSSNDGSTSLHLAAGMGELDTVAFLLNEKISPNIEKKKGFTPLHMASMNKRLPTMRLLIEHKADVNSVGKKGESVLYQATVYGDVEPMRILLEEKANVNAVTYEGGTALYLAAQEGHLDAVKILIEYGADPQFKFQNRTPLFIAVEKKTSFCG